MLKFAYASIDENGKTSGGKKGDQTGREIKVAKAYNFGQTKVLHCKNMVKRHRIAKLAVTVANNPAYGYSQGRRHTGYNYIMELIEIGIKSPLKKIAKNKKQYDFDCSSLVSAAVNFAYKKPKIGLCYTGNMENYVSTMKGKNYSLADHTKRECISIKET